jgi:hypothetical protein
MERADEMDEKCAYLGLMQGRRSREAMWGTAAESGTMASVPSLTGRAQSRNHACDNATLSHLVLESFISYARCEIMRNRALRDAGTRVLPASVRHVFVWRRGQ